MDDGGPLYNVRMRLGQGYNSFTQEPCIDNAVTFEYSSDAPTPLALKASTEPGGESADKKAILGGLAKVLETISKTTLSQKDMISNFVELMMMETRKDDSSPKAPYNFKPDAAAQPNQNVVFSSRQVDKTSDINDVLGISSSAAMKAGSIGVGGEAGGSLASEKELKESDLNFFVSVKVVNELDDKEKPAMSFNEIPNLRGQLMAEDRKDERAAYFNKIYGDTFISDFVVGGELYALVRIKLRDKKKLADVRAYASAQLTPPSSPLAVEAKTDSHKSGREAFNQSEIFIRVQWRGGGEIKSHDVQWGLDGLVRIANAFPSLVAIKSAKIRAVLTPYASLKSFQDWIHKTSFEDALKLSEMTFRYDLCSVYVEMLYADFNAYSQLCTDLEHMINNISDYRVRKIGGSDQGASHARDGQHRGRGRKPRKPGLPGISRKINASQPAHGGGHVSEVDVGEERARSTYRQDDGQDRRSRRERSPLPRPSPSHHPSPPPSRSHSAPLPSRHFSPPPSRSTSPAPSSLLSAPFPYPLPAWPPRSPIDGRAPFTQGSRVLDFPHMKPIKPDGVKLAEVQYLCRSAMLFIRQEVLDIAQNPGRVRLNILDGEQDPWRPDQVGGTRVMMPREYPFPAQIAACLPVPVDDRGMDDGFVTPDLSPAWVLAIRENPYIFSCTSVGETLSPRKKYDFFSICNFRSNDHTRPHAITVHLNPRHWLRFGSAAARNKDVMPFVCGIELAYAEEASRGGHRIVSPTTAQLRGRKGETSVKLRGAAEKSELPKGVKINRVKIWYSHGQGRINRIQFYWHENILATEFSENGHLDYKPLLSTAGVTESEWDNAFDSVWSRAPTQSDGHWEFAGLMGAYEKIGPFGRDRALAKIAVAWKKMDAF